TFFFFLAPPPPPLSPLSLHDALPISLGRHLDPDQVDGRPCEPRLHTQVGVFLGREELSRNRMVRVLHLDSALPQHLHRPDHPARSEEHTSELQSRFDLVCRLLLEKKK